jgi:hypothetical protein
LVGKKGCAGRRNAGVSRVGNVCVCKEPLHSVAQQLRKVRCREYEDQAVYEA